MRELARDRLGEDMFAIWLGPLELIAVDASVLVIAAPPETVGWVRARYGRLLSATAERTGRELRFAVESERLAFGTRQERASISGPARWERPNHEPFEAHQRGVALLASGNHARSSGSD